MGLLVHLIVLALTSIGGVVALLAYRRRRGRAEAAAAVGTGPAVVAAPSGEDADAPA
jgi:alpha-beta hydrolase superfamily lysophospholipase